MPLPDTNVDWPPKDTTQASKLVDKWQAWYSGDPDHLAKVYSTSVSPGIGVQDPRALVRPSTMRGGVIGVAARFFWGAPPQAGSLASAKLHIPLPADVAATSADLLFGEPPGIIAPDGEDATQKRLDFVIADGGLHSSLLEAAETIAALGGGYLRITWDPEVAGYPLVDGIPPDAAIPTFRSGRLVAVTFWRKLAPLADGKITWRHLELHEPGRVWHGLYATTSEDKLGRSMPLADHPETEPFAELVGPQGYVETGAQGLTAEYVPNMRPNRVLRGSPLGRSDYQGNEPLFDALDEAWTSWMRDLRLGKARLIVPAAYTQSAGGRGKGAYFDPEQEIFQTVEALPSPDGGLSISQVQFAIRVAEHAQTTDALAKLALRGCGYNESTFGEAGDTAITATEVDARDRRTRTTRARKIEYWRGPLARLMQTYLQVDVAKFGTPGVKDVPVTIEWPDAVAVDPQQQAQTLQLLAAAQAASIKTRVEMLHPDWKEPDVDAEVKLIQAEAAPPPVPEPGSPLTGGTGIPKPAPKPAAKPVKELQQ